MAFIIFIYRANPSQQCADRKTTNLNTIVYVLHCCKGSIMLFLFGTAKISILSRPGKKRAGRHARPALRVIKTYGLAIDREVFFRMSPSSDKATDNV